VPGVATATAGECEELGMSGTLLVTLSALIAAVIGAALVGATTDDVLSPWPDGHGRDHARASGRGSDPDPD
jgi:hypothetical protein